MLSGGVKKQNAIYIQCIRTRCKNIIQIGIRKEYSRSLLTYPLLVLFFCFLIPQLYQSLHSSIELLFCIFYFHHLLSIFFQAAVNLPTPASISIMGLPPGFHTGFQVTSLLRIAHVRFQGCMKTVFQQVHRLICALSSL